MIVLIWQFTARWSCEKFLLVPHSCLIELKHQVHDYSCSHSEVKGKCLDLNDKENNENNININYPFVDIRVNNHICPKYNKI